MGWQTMRKMASLFLTIFSSVLLTTCCGCGTRHILQRPGTGVVLLKEIKGAKVSGPDENGKQAVGTVNLPAGTVCGVPGAVAPEKK